MNQEVLYGGMTTAPNERQSADGEMLMAVNMVRHPDGYGGIELPENPAFFVSGFSPLYIHREPSDGKDIVIGVELKSGANINVLAAYVKESSSYTKVSVPYYVVKENEIPDRFASSGNIVVFNHQGKLKYLLYQGDKYLLMGRLPEYIPIEFAAWRCEDKITYPETDTDGQQYRDRPENNYCNRWLGLLPAGITSVDTFIAYDEATNKPFDPYHVPDSSLFTDANLKADDAVIGVLNKGISQFKTKGALVYPALIRYAIKLSTGDYIQYSPPMLLMPREDTIQVIGDGDGKVGGYRRTNQMITVQVNPNARVDILNRRCIGVYVEAYKPCLTIHHKTTEVLRTLKNTYGELIEGVDVFMSNPIPTIQTDHILSRKYKEGFHATWDESLEGFYPKDTNESELWYTKPYFAKSRNFVDKIRETTEYFLIRSFTISELEDISLQGVYTPLVRAEDVYKLETLPNQKRMPINSYSNSDIGAGVVYSANSRIVLGDVKKYLPDPWPITQMCPKVLGWNQKAKPIFDATPPTADAYGNLPKELCHYTLYKGVCNVGNYSEVGVKFSYSVNGINENNQTYSKVHSMITNTPYDYAIPRLLTYAEPSGKYVLISRDGYSDNPLKGNSVKLPLIRNNYAPESGYWYPKRPENLDLVKEVPESFGALHTRYTQQIKLSEVGSPLSFTDGNSVLCGNGRVQAIDSQVYPMSEGEYGQYRLMAFCTDGLYSINLQNDGSSGNVVCMGHNLLVSDARQLAHFEDNLIAVFTDGVALIHGVNVDYILKYYPDVRMNVSEKQKALCSTMLTGDVVPWDISLKNFFVHPQTWIGYDRHHNRIIVCNPTAKYSFVYATGGKSWSILTEKWERRVDNHTGELIVQDGIGLCNLGEETHTQLKPKGMLCVRADKWSNADVHKSFSSILQRGTYAMKAVKQGCYGSNDLQNWVPVWSSDNGYLRPFSTSTPYKYFRLIVFTDITHSLDRLSGYSVNYTDKLTNIDR